MPVTQFPDPREADSDGLVAVGGDLEPETLILAYRSGIFPWPMGRGPLPWCSPDPRAILEFERLHVPRSLKKSLGRAHGQRRLAFTVDQAFDAVIRACAKVPRPGQSGTWITPRMLKAYGEFHRRGYAHSIEVWEENELIGGVYGVDVDGVFAGESMFHLKPNASKLGLLFLIDHLRAAGARWMDIQMLTPHMKALGAREIPRDEFLDRLALERQRGIRLFQPCQQ
ncbi:MAG: leucyl/phenylalanyl-tRNA--protein transferase [Oligoflexia bacterium]|nr:leucyl/phenylalanyl-tRNA--protein transferase [Oligoflexia bacterium]